MPTPQNDFLDHIKQALRHFDDFAWIGENSPLATPFFLVQYLTDNEDTHHLTKHEKLGYAFTKMIDEAYQTQLKPLLSAKDRIILEEELYPQDELTEDGEKKKTRFDKVKEKIEALDKNSIPCESNLNVDKGAPVGDVTISKATYHRRKNIVVEQLGQACLRYLKLPLRSEPPTSPPLYGRSSADSVCRRALKRGEKVGVYGQGGIGKTALGGQLAQTLADEGYHVFWCTFQTGLNDHLFSLAFSLSYFLQQHLNQRHQISSTLFATLIHSVEEMYIAPNLIVEQLREDLAALNGVSLLLCFDEVDLLKPDESVNHAQLLTFLEKLTQLPTPPMLFIGQQLPFDLPFSHQLKGLSQAAITELLQTANICLSPTDLSRLARYCQGNARLLQLFIALHQVDKPLSDILTEDMLQASSMEYLLNRVWRRLEEVDMALLCWLSVFRRPVPLTNHTEVLQKLSKLHLIQYNSKRGLVNLLPTFKRFFYAKTPSEEQLDLHCKAAQVRRNYGEMTAVAYHLIKSGLIDEAVTLWHQYQQAEIEQGQAQIALALFEPLSPDNVSNSSKPLLLSILGQLYKLLGNYDAVNQTVRAVMRPSTLQAHLKRLTGDIADLKSQYKQAARDYRGGLETIEQLLYEKAIFHKNLSWIHQQEQNFEQAWYQAEFAECEAKYMKGEISRKRGQKAEQYYRESLAIAETIGYQEGIAKNNEGLAIILVDLGREDEAEVCEEKALAIYTKIGRVTRIAGIRATQASRYNLVTPPQPEKAIESAKKALKLCKQLNEPRNEATACQNLAEAYQILEEWDEAERYAHQVVQIEESEHLPDGLRVLGEVKLVRGELNEAQSYIQESIDLSQKNQDPFLEAYAWRAMGRLQCVRQDKRLAEQAFECAYSLFEEMGAATEMTRTQEAMRECGVAE